jgi:hypothetical protein
MTGEDEALWRRRFAAFALFRLSGLAGFLGGLAVAVSDWVRPGGWPAPGIVIAVLGLLLATVPPALLRRSWRQDGK